jgi:hypothetical protein
MCGRITRRGCRQGVVQVYPDRSGARNFYSLLSGLEDVVFNDVNKDHYIPEGDGQSRVRFCIPS